MPVSIQELRSHLQAFDLPRLFVDSLGWNRYVAEPLAVLVDGRGYSLKPVAEKAGFQVFECSPGQDGAVPPYPVRRKIESQVTKSAFEHLVIFVDEERATQIWQWVKRESGKPAACREQAFYKGQGGDSLLQRLRQIAFTLDEEAGLNIPTVVSKVRKALDVEKLTKRFYDRFRSELTAFGAFIKGITVQVDRDWYASLMLNRMMFIYFVQKQGFLDDDLDYLRNRLRMVKQQRGDGRFQQFYRIFLLRLFHEGLGQPEAQRAPDLVPLLGKVPFLNGGLFDVHDLEHDNPEISIPDEAFEKVFDFFDDYRWHLDERRYWEDNEINPDVLGYIFEKYVNQKQMGAYYTKEDITGYISRNAVIPFLFEAARKECPVAFGPDGGVWRRLRDDPDDYVYPAVGHGVTWNARRVEDPKRLDRPLPLPNDVATGIKEISERAGWNGPAPDEYALPTETWREVVARRQRYAEVQAKLTSGEVQETNDLVTLNLDVERFAKDVIAQSEGPELLRAFWHALSDVSILDPTCGSGAFLFAALNVLEPLYTACLEGMRGFLGDLERTERPHHPDALRDFRDVLGRVGKHPSERYFILKSIVLNNLYGVDIMEEAVEICKLRLFLKLVAQLKSYDQIEPLPDIDFNVRAGNTLVGFTSLDAVRQAMTITPDGQCRALFDEDRAALTRIEKEAEATSRAFDLFREQQTSLGGEVMANDKADLRQRLERLGRELDRLLATEYGIDLGKQDTYDAWETSHQPFHWFAEFYGIMRRGGFDVIIGNPPYKELRAVTEYKIRGLSSASTKNLYPLVMERSLQFSQHDGRLGFIVPVSSISTMGYKVLQDIILRYSGHFSSYDDRPSRLFDGLEHARLTIHLIVRQPPGTTPTYSATEFYRWNSVERPYLFRCLRYEGVKRDYLIGCLPKISRSLEHSIIQKIWSDRMPLSEQSGIGGHAVYYSRKISHFLQALDFVPEVYDGNGNLREPTELKELRLSSTFHAALVFCLLNSSLFRWFIDVFSDCRHVNKREVEGFRLDLERALAGANDVWVNLAEKLTRSLRDTAEFRDMRFKHDRLRVQCIIPKFSKPIIDEIDRILAEHYGFTDEELDFIINYDIKYRMGRDG